MLTEADTCRKLVVPKLQAAGWTTIRIRSPNNGRLRMVGWSLSATGFVGKPSKKVDYLLRYTRDFPLAVVEAKS